MYKIVGQHIRVNDEHVNSYGKTSDFGSPGGGRVDKRKGHQAMLHLMPRQENWGRV